MAILDCLLSVSVALLAVWTISLHLCIACGWPAWSVIFPLVIGMALLHWLLAPGWRVAWREASAREERSWLAALLAAALAFAALALILDVPTADDFNFFHRALAQLGALGEPFLLSDTAFNEDGLAPISPLHVLTSWELGIAMAAGLVGIDPLGAYHNGSVVLLHGVLVATYAALLRELGFGLRATLVGVVAILAFLLLDDPSLRSFGFAYRTLWVGKSAQWVVLFPLLTLFALRYAREPNLASWVRVACACSAAIGLSGTGVFLAPGLVGCAAVAGLAMRSGAAGESIAKGTTLREMVVLPLAAFHPLILGALLVFGVLRQPEDMSAWTAGFPGVWSENLLIALGNGYGVVRAAVLALLVPLLVLDGRERRFLVGLSLMLLAFFANPWMGELWLGIVQPGAYWRVMFLFPIPLGVGLAAASLVDVVLGAVARTTPRAKRFPAAIAGVAAIGSVALGWMVSAPDARRMPLPFRTKAPLEWRLPRAEASFAREVSADLAGRSLLAGPPLSWVASLVVPGVRLEAARHKDTLHVFANVGRPEEGRRRVAAWEWARRCEAFPPGAGAALESLRGGVDALAFPICPAGASGERELQELLARAPGRWQEAHRAHGYRLWLRTDSAR